jgi:hypothetical protein
MRYNSILFLIAASIIAMIFWILVDNTYDAGDSITHYAIAHYSWRHPYLLFDNWGKPVFTILSSPFAQFGWKGITFFNSCTGILACWLIAEIIHKLKWRVSPYAALLLFFIPNYPLALNSGLTEPLYALLLTLTVYYSVVGKYMLSAIAISFLPFVRSEGFISIMVVAVFFIASSKWKEILYMLTGTLCISVAGMFVHDKNILWVFSTNPYAVSQPVDTYGAGAWSDYFSKFYYMTGIPFTALFWIASIVLTIILIKKIGSSLKTAIVSTEYLLLGLFFSFFLAHVVFWKFGLFNSFGMSRVLISIVPIGLLMVCYLFDWLLVYSDKNILTAGICAFVFVLFPFLNNKSAWNFSKEFKEDAEIAEIKKISSDIRIDTFQTDRIYYTSTPLMVLLKCDIYDTCKYKLINKFKKDIKPGYSYIVVKDQWSMKMESTIMNEDLIFAGVKKIYSRQLSETNSVDIYSSDQNAAVYRTGK